VVNDVFLLIASVCLGGAVALGYRLWAALVGRFNATYEADLRARMDRIGMDSSRVGDYLRWRIEGGIAAGLGIGIGMGMAPIGVLVGFGIYMVVPILLERNILQCRGAIRDQLVVATRNLAGQIRGQAILIRGLARVADQTPDPLGKLLRQVTGKVSRNVPFKVALTDLKDRVQMDYMSLLVLTLAIAYEKKEGSSLADLLDGIAHSLSENQRMDRKREADTAAGRFLINIMAAFPVAFLGMFYAMDPEATSLVFTTLAGQFVLVIVAGIVWFSMSLAKRILNQVV
jgi:Flp pilus assembly protein TadB